jgi:hypothetical protein
MGPMNRIRSAVSGSPMVGEALHVGLVGLRSVKVRVLKDRLPEDHVKGWSDRVILPGYKVLLVFHGNGHICVFMIFIFDAVGMN